MALDPFRSTKIVTLQDDVGLTATGGPLLGVLSH